MNLTALQHSPFLQSLGWAIANSLWQAAALLITYHLIIGGYKNASAKLKNNLSTILLFAAFVWFCVTFFIKYLAIEDQPGNYDIQYYNAADITAAATWNELLNKVAGVLPYLSIAYLLLLIFLTFRLINIYRFTLFIKFNGLQKPGVEWKLFTEKVGRHMGITKQIRLWVSHHIDVPATIGFIKPVILIPLASINQLSSDQLEAIILHELSHIKRNDYLINLFVSIIETILFFNPFIVLLAKIIKRERENCCDDFVIQYQYDRHTYASALLSLEQFRNTDLRLAIGATSGKKQLLLRIKRIMEVNSNTNFNYGQKLAALLLITGVICSVAWLSPQNKETKKQLVNKIQDKILDSKASKDEKAETLFVKIDTGTAKNNKPKYATVRLQPKKVVTRTEKQLKELQDLNLQEIAEEEYKLAYRLLQESKKQVVRKPLRYSLNKILLTRGTGHTPSLFDNIMTSFVPANFEFARQKAFSVDVQKFQEEIDNAQFYFSFDNDQAQTVLKKVSESKPFQRVRQREVVKDEDVQKVNAEIETAGGRLQRVRINNMSGRVVSTHGGTIYIADSLTERQIRILTERAKQIQGNTNTKVNSAKATTPYDNIATTNTRQLAAAYAYGNATNTEDKSKKNTVRVVGGSGTTDMKQSPATPVVPGMMYRLMPDVNSSFQAPKPRTNTTHKEEIHVEYKNGVVVINGKKIELPDTRELFALYSIKGKKIISKVKDLTELHIED